MVDIGDRRREFLAKFLSDIAKVIIAAIVASKICGGINWTTRILRRG